MSKKKSGDTIKGKREVGFNEQELLVKARKLQQEKIKKASDEIAEILDKYRLSLVVAQNIQIVPRTR